MNALLKCRDCGEDYLPQDLRPTHPADATPISKTAVDAGLGAYGLAAQESGLGQLSFAVARAPLRLWLLRAAFIVSGILGIWLLLSR